MDLMGSGLNKGSYMYFFTPSDFAKRSLFYPLCAGEFFCDEDYEVKRNQYNSFLLLCVLEGEIKTDSQCTKGGEAILIDCYKRHSYFSDSSAHTLWLHFDGSFARALFEEITSLKGEKIKFSDSVKRNIINIIGTSDETRQSEMIYKILMRLLSTKSSAGEKALSKVEGAKEFILNNYQKELMVSDMAKSVSLSPSYFSRVFKKNTAVSPYDYLLSIRLERAKELLVNSDMQISEIAYKTGFKSTSNFIYFFKNETNLSPLKFRKLKF
ncbi:MAG: helix-turn-helix transcriptional regulator [Eubacterium sp.]|nr:helix-turn-helix transcriptional regulator [Eubacterium sp.]